MIIWNRKVFKNCFKSINKGLKLEIKNYYKILHTDIKKNFNHSIPEEEDKHSAEIEQKFQDDKKESENFIVEIRNSLVDLSLNYHSVNFLEHSSFFKSKNDIDEF